MNRFGMATVITLFLLGMCFQSTHAAGGGAWGYSGDLGPLNWGKNYPDCDGSSQSPINIYEGDVAQKTVSETFNYKNYDVVQKLTMKLSNTGHGAQIGLSGENLPEISGGGLDGDYVAAQFHFHWSGDEDSGSEHLISSKGFPGEMHIVHYKKTYPNISEALTHADGLAVLGFMLKLTDESNANYDNLIESISGIIQPDTEVDLGPRTLNSFLPTTFNNFYRYSGSLTTPPCYETVTWTVFQEEISISREQVSNFLNLIDQRGLYILHNARPDQPINGRVVQANFNPDIHWEYYPGHVDPPHWSDYYESCGKKAQSPINIPSAEATEDNNLDPFSFQRFGETSGITMELANNGHTVKVDIGGNVPSVTGGSLPDQFNVAQFHYHWGATNMRGSEHTLDAKMYPMEVHVVMFKTSLTTIGNALKKPEGLAVLGFFFELSDSDNPDLNPVLNALSSVQNPGDNTTLTTFSLDSFLPADRSNYYRYAGSLTTPGCYESVIWTVFTSTIPVSGAQLMKLRSLTSSEKDKTTQALLPIVDNYRPVQFLNSRIIRRNFAVAPKPKIEWSYYGETGSQNWAKNFHICASTTRQSPINIEPKNAIMMEMPEIKYMNFQSTNVAFKIKNNGHSVTVSYKSGDVEISQEGLGEFKVAQFHFHWGSVSSQGSEHFIEDKKFPMELHIVTYNKLYDNIGLSITQGNGLAVLGFMFQISSEDNPRLNTLVENLAKVQNPGDEANLPAFSLNSILPSDRKGFYRYDGSLTTPTCDESVTWTVFESTIDISENQLNVFRRLDSSEFDEMNNTRPMVDNFRPVQPLGDRVVYANFLLGGAPSSSTTTPLMVSVVFTLGKLAWSYN